MHLYHITLMEFKQGNNAVETSRIICSAYSQGVISDRQIVLQYLLLEQRTWKLSHALETVEL